MPDQNENTENTTPDAAGGASTAPSTAPVAPEVDIQALQTELESLRGHKSKLEADLKKNRDTKTAALAEQGRFEELAKAREMERDEALARVAELEGLTSVKESHESLQKDLKKMVKARLALLPEGDTVGALISELSDPIKQLRHLDAHLAALPKPETRSTEPDDDVATPAAASGGAVTSLAGLRGAALEEAINRDREGINERARAFGGVRATALAKHLGLGGN